LESILHRVKGLFSPRFEIFPSLFTCLFYLLQFVLSGLLFITDMFNLFLVFYFGFSSYLFCFCLQFLDFTSKKDCLSPYKGPFLENYVITSNSCRGPTPNPGSHVQSYLPAEEWPASALNCGSGLRWFLMFPIGEW